MQIETYETEEIKGDAGVMAADAEAIELAARLGLSGQAKLTNADTATRMAFRRLRVLERNIADVLFTQRCDVANYESGCIPLRVLRVLESAKETNLFERFEVWAPKDATVPDPLLIGMRRTDPRYEWSVEPFLIARWGEALPSWDDLAKLASERWIARSRLKLRDTLIEARQELDTLSETARAAFLGEIELPSIR